RDDRAGLLERGLRVLQPVAREHADDALRVAGAVVDQAGDRGGAGRLAEDALARGEQAVGVEDLLVADGVDAAARVAHRGHRLLPARGVADADGACHRLRLLHALTGDERRRAFGLEAIPLMILDGPVAAPP